MYLSHLKLQAFRNILSLEIFPQLGVNLILGPNASGKTTLLEAIYLLSHGRSFKARYLNELIQFNEKYFSSFAEIKKKEKTFNCGFMKYHDSPAQIQIDGQRTRFLSKLAQRLPSLLISPESFKLLHAGANERRQFLDWGVFHVEHQFCFLWQQYQKVLKQRNAELKLKAYTNVLSGWDRQIIDLGEKVTDCRKAYWDIFLSHCMAQINILLPIPDLTIDFEQGWPVTDSLEAALKKSLSSDLRRGFTQVGPHRADIVVKQKGVSAANILSRGQQKLLICAFYLAAGKFLVSQTQMPCVYLVDDIAAELDAYNQKRVLYALSNIAQQMFITGLDEYSLRIATDNLPVTLFHVEQFL